MNFINSKAAQILTAVLVLQAVVSYGMARKESTPANVALSTLSPQLGSWRLVQEGVVDQDTRDVLRADEILTRDYISQSYRLEANLFVAYFRTQRTGQAPHSPKNCLPGNGWVQQISDQVKVDISGREPIEVNRYIVAKGENKSLVLYWYQSRDRVVADEFRAKFYVVNDAIRYNRTDTALIRVIIPIAGDGVERAESAARDFIQAFFTPLRAHFPKSESSGG